MQIDSLNNQYLSSVYESQPVKAVNQYDGQEDFEQRQQQQKVASAIYVNQVNEAANFFLEATDTSKEGTSSTDTDSSLLQDIRSIEDWLHKEQLVDEYYQEYNPSDPTLYGTAQSPLQSNHVGQLIDIQA